MRNKKRRIIVCFISLILFFVLLFTIMSAIPPADTAPDWQGQYNTISSEKRQLWETFSFLVTIIGVVVTIGVLRFWYRYRNERDPHYWNGEYTTIPESFIKEGSIKEFQTGRCGGGRDAMGHVRDFHQTAAAFLPPTKGQPGSAGFWRIY